MGRLARFSITPRAFAYVAYAALAVCTLIVFTGAAVRLTGSGLGCPDWPRCQGTRLTPELSTHALIEFGNRMLTGVVGIPCLAAAILAWFRRPFRRDLALIAALLPLGVLGQAVLGGLTVIYGLSPSWVIGHFLLSMALLVACVALAWRAQEPPRAPAHENRLTVYAVRALLVLGGITLALGTIATAAGPHAGGEGTGDEVVRLTWRGADTLDWAIHQHGALATLLGLAAVGTWFLARSKHAGAELQAAITTVCVLLACQGLVGAVQYSMELPAEIVWFHVVLAACTWLALLWAMAAAGRVTKPQPPREQPRAEREPALTT
jgi:heme a synthase